MAGDSGSSDNEGGGGEEEEEMAKDEEVAEEVTEMTDYERERLQVVRRNRNVLANLQVKNLAKSLDPEAASAGGAKKNSKAEKSTKEVSSSVKRRSQRLISTTGKRSASKPVVDWSSDSSQAPSDSDSDSDSDGPFVSNSRVKKSISLDFTKKKDVEYKPSESSDSEDSVEEEQLHEELPRVLPKSRKSNTPTAKRPRGGKSLRSPGKWSMSLNSPSKLLHSPAQLQLDVDMDEDFALQQALALSMGSSLEMLSPTESEQIKGEPSSRGPSNHSGTKATQKRMRKSKERTFTTSDIDAFFMSVVGSSQGQLSIRHLEKVASAHDFTWTTEELQDMIDVFDKDCDGQANGSLLGKCTHHRKPWLSQVSPGSWNGALAHH